MKDLNRYTNCDPEDNKEGLGVVNENGKFKVFVAKDIIEEFGIKPGPKVGELLGRAKTLWIEEKCNREGLLKLVRNEIDQPNSNVTNAEKS